MRNIKSVKRTYITKISRGVIYIGQWMRN